MRMSGSLFKALVARMSAAISGGCKSCPGYRCAHPGYKATLLNCERDFVFSRHRVPEACQKVSPTKVEGAGKTGCALHPRSRVQDAHSKKAHEHTGSAEAFRPSLRNGFTAYFVLSPVNGFLATVAAPDIGLAQT